MINLLAVIICAVVACVSIEVIQNLRSRRFWKQWERDSFEYQGTRYAKDTFEVRDGKVVLTKRGNRAHESVKE